MAIFVDPYVSKIWVEKSKLVSKYFYARMAIFGDTGLEKYKLRNV